MNTEKQKTKVTISVPVYNVEKYIRKCLDSLVSQTLGEIEIILVNDGSTDDSGQICDEYAVKDSRIKVIHKQNGGLASARQVALENAHGEYFICCDSDDWVEPTMYEEMYAKAKETDADMVICDFAFNYPDGRETVSHQPQNLYTQDDVVKAMLSRKLSPNTWNKLTRTSIYYKYNLTWNPEICQGEDALMFRKLLLHPMNIVFLPKVFYHYRRDMLSGSYTNNIRLKSFRNVEYIYDFTWTHYDNQNYAAEKANHTIQLAFNALRCTEMTKELFQASFRDKLSLSTFFRYRSASILKSAIVFIAKIDYSLGHHIMRKYYKYFYK